MQNFICHRCGCAIITGSFCSECEPVVFQLREAMDPKFNEACADAALKMNAYLVIVTWPNGTEGLLFPRPGNVPIASTLKQGMADYEKAKHDLEVFVSQLADDGPDQVEKIQIRLVQFKEEAVICSYPQ